MCHCNMADWEKTACLPGQEGKLRAGCKPPGGGIAQAQQARHAPRSRARRQRWEPTASSRASYWSSRCSRTLAAWSARHRRQGGAKHEQECPHANAQVAIQGHSIPQTRTTCTPPAPLTAIICHALRLQLLLHQLQLLFCRLHQLGRLAAATAAPAPPARRRPVLHQKAKWRAAAEWAHRCRRGMWSSCQSCNPVQLQTQGFAQAEARGPSPHAASGAPRCARASARW